MSAARIEAAFRERSSKGRLALVPFLTAGWPNADTTVETAVALAAAGASALELGIPFSDPIADGPVIQATYQEALEGGTHLPETLAMAARIRARCDLPLIAMTYGNPVLRFGPERFARESAAAGIDGVILTDVPPDELPSLWAPLRAAGLGTVLLVTPLTRAERRARVLAESSGFVYVVSRTGVTGSGDAAEGLETLLAELRAATRVPVAVGFGIESPAHVLRYRGRADGVIVGTALLRRMREAGGSGMPGAAARFLQELNAAATSG